MKGCVPGVSIARSRSVSLSTITRFTEAGVGCEGWFLHTRPIIVQPNLYCSAQGSSSWPDMTFIGWKAAGTFQPMSRPISTSGRCCILSAMWDKCVHWLATRGVAISSWEAGMYSREYANGILIGVYSLSMSWMNNPATFLVLIVFEPTIVLTCRSTSSASTSSWSSKVSEMNTSVDWSSRTAYVVNSLFRFEWWLTFTRTILAHDRPDSYLPQTCVQVVDEFHYLTAWSQYALLWGAFSGKCHIVVGSGRIFRRNACLKPCT